MFSKLFILAQIQDTNTPAVQPQPAVQPAPQITPPTSAQPTPVSNAGVQTTITTNQYGKKFLVLHGNTFELNKKVPLGKAGLNFQYFKGTWSKRIDFITDKDKQALIQNGVDISVLDAPQQEQPTQPVDPNAAKGSASAQIQKFKEDIEKEMTSGQGNTRVKAILNHIDKTLDQLAASVDEAAKQDFVKNFLTFSSKFWHYSFSNQMLIFMQKPDSTYVKGFKQWMDVGRQVINWKNGISILAPTVKKEVDRNTGEENKRLFFFPVAVYDIADTQPIPNWKDQQGNGPFEGKPPLKTNPNEENEEVTALVQAASRFAKRMGITVDLEKKLNENLGGYSTGGDVVINKDYKGINQFSTLIHEMAHEALHWEKDKPKILSKQDMFKSRQSMEIDAEATAFIVLKHYGFDTKDAPNYLALWKADSAQVRSRREHISNAVKVIIKGIESEMSKVEVPDEESALVPETTASSWYRIRFG